MDTVQQFYDNLAATYHFILADWQKSVQWHGATLAGLLKELGAPPPRTLLDCTCGIGTQAIGLALEGYHVHGSDLSPVAIERAIEYASRFQTDAPPTFTVADLLTPPARPVQYDIVLSCDNAVAHFHTDTDLEQALDTMTLQLKPGGVLLISLRDYDAAVQNPQRATPVSVKDDSEAGDRKSVV